MINHMKCLIGFLFLITVSTTPLADNSSPFSKELWVKGVNYELGRGVKRNYKLAYIYYCRAAKSNNPNAFFSIGWMFMGGLGLPQDIRAAKAWFEQAAAMGDKQAKKLVKRFKSVTPRYDKLCSFKKTSITREKIKKWVRTIAGKYRIDPQLVFSVINRESAFDPNALSAKNARGLMQLIPATARRFGVKNIWDPKENIKGGIAYLNWLLRYFKGDVKLALAGYNAGEGAVRKYNGIPPYKETEDYVRRIIKVYKKTRHPIPPKIKGIRM